MSLNIQQRLAKNSRFLVDNIGVGGPINIILSCSVYNNDNYREGYNSINWNKESICNSSLALAQDAAEQEL